MHDSAYTSGDSHGKLIIKRGRILKTITKGEAVRKKDVSAGQAPDKKKKGKPAPPRNPKAPPKKPKTPTTPHPRPPKPTLPT
jgi:hypothetical protein